VLDPRASNIDSSYKTYRAGLFTSMELFGTKEMLLNFESCETYAHFFQN
jgi:hypothetical protein